MSKNRWGWYLGMGMIIASAYASWAKCALAQITPDSTLPNNSTVNINGNIFNITGGTQAGKNLFHSFQSFSIPSGREAHFNNAVDINNIISRVTGSSVSDINGLIKVLGNANLFLLNPNGIVFGQNARLDIRGSFVASTANSIKFADGFEFSAKNIQSTPLLTVSVPLGLQFGANPQRIQVIGDGQGIRYLDDPIIDNKPALRVPENQTLALVGGDISLEGATLKTAGGRIQLGSVSGEGLVTLTPINKGFALGYAAGQNLGNIELFNQATIDASGVGGGDVLLTGRRVSLKDGSQIEASTLGSQSGGTLALNASELVEVGDPGSGLFVAAYPSATGAAGNLTIQTGKLLVQNGGFVSAGTYGAGKGGNLTVNASEKVEVTGTSTDGYISALFTGTSAQTTGAAGDLTINTPVLQVRDGAIVSASTGGAGNGGNLTVNALQEVQVIDTRIDGKDGSDLDADTYGTGNAGNLTINTRRLVVKDSQVGTTTFGQGNAGILTVNASESIELSGYLFDKVDEYPAGLFAQVNSQGSGRGGTLNIETGRLSISNGAKVQVATFGQGDAGDLFIRASEIDIFETTQPRYTYYPTGIFAGVRTTRAATQLPKGNGGSATIETNRLTVRNGGVVTTTTQGLGNAGTLRIRATESIEVFGTAPGAEFRDLEEPRNSEISAASTFRSTGNGGLLSIDTGKLIVRDKGTVSVRSEGKEQAAGNLEINARSINLDNGSLTATTNSGNGGNMSLTVKDLLLLRNQSTISATAGTAQQGGNGGNITINAPNGFIVTLPDENSDITADAFSGQGGNVTIRAANIFNIAPRSRQELERLRPDDLNPRQLQTNDITAISQQNPTLGGQISINTPDVDPNRGLVELPTVVVDTSNQINTSCAAFANGEGNQFTVTGRGGLPASPNEPLTTDVVWSDTRLPATTTRQDREETPSTKPAFKPEAVAIVPATGWVFNDKGEVTLISHMSSAASLGPTAASCPQR